MITPIKTMTVNQIAERKDDLLMSSDDIKELARNERNKAIEEFAERLKGKIFSHFTYRGIIEEPTDYSDYIDEIAEEMRGAE